MQRQVTYWFCTRCKHAWLGSPECSHTSKQHRATCDTDYWLWWRYRLATKPDDVRRAINDAGQGLRYDHWDRVVDVLTRRARRVNHTFVVVPLDGPRI